MLIGTMLRNIRIVESLGEGGMGEVYVGLDERLGRRVAVKAVRRERRMDHRARERFAREARILSQLEHPNICRIYEFLEEGEADYIVMELVEGTDLAQVAAQGRSFQAKLAIAEQVARALVAAHTVSVIHRDLKPEHVVVDDDGLVKVLDFGLARAAAESEDAGGQPVRNDSPPPVAEAASDGRDLTLTEIGDVVGTPRSMSPEQARGEPLTAASDMYSFGLVLQELFTGKRPYPEGLTFPELKQKAMWGETLPVEGVDSQLSGLISRLKSFAPTDRPSAVETAERLRWIRERPRRRLRRIAVAAVAGGLVIAATSSLLGLAHARRSLAIARAAEAEAAREAAVAREVSDFLVGVFSVSDPSESRGNTVTAREILDAAADRIERELVTEPLTQARLMDTMGEVYRELGLYEPAARLLERALELRTREHGPGHAEVAASQEHLAELEYSLGHYDRSEALARAALEIRERRHGVGAPETARALNVLASVAFSRSEHERAADLFRRVVASIEAGLGPDHPDLADPLGSLGVTLKVQGDFEGAQAAVSRALAVIEKGSGSDHPLVAVLLRELASIATSQGDDEVASRHLERALEIQEKVLSPDHPAVASLLRQLAMSLTFRGEFDRAEELLQRSLEIVRRTLGPRHRQAAWTMQRLATIKHSRGDFDQAEALLGQACETFREAVGDRHAETAGCLLELGLLAHDTGRLERAEALDRQALEVLLDLRGPDDTDVAFAEARLARVLMKRGKLEEAGAMYEHARRVHAARVEANPRDRASIGVLGSVLVGLGELATRGGKPEEARRLWSEAVRITQPLEASFALLRAQEYRVKALLLLGRVDDARPTAQQLLAVGWSDPDLRTMCRARGISPPTQAPPG